MSENKKTTPDDLYFVTLTVVDWINLFDRQVYKNIIVDNLNYCVEKEGLDIYAYVIMSNHLHMICRRRDKDLYFTKYLNSLKYIPPMINVSDEGA